MKASLWLLASCLLATLPAVSSCDQIECGPGTIEDNGSCVPTDAIPDGSRCGMGTTLDPDTLECVNDSPIVECGPNTVEDVDPVTGHTICVGTGNTSCDSPISGCVSPTVSGRVTLCGKFFDTETGAPIVAEGATGEQCSPTTTTPAADGPCALALAFYDPIDFLVNQENSEELDAGEIFYDDCGRFRAVDLAVPVSGFIAVALDDHDNASQDLHRLTGIALTAVPNTKDDTMRPHVTRITTDQAWTASAGNPFGAETFADHGVFFQVHLHDGEPVAGVRITRSGQPQADKDYYFSDTDPSIRRTVDVGLTQTGVNGAGMMVDSTLQIHGATGGEPNGCTWDANQAASIRNVVFFRELELLTDDGMSVCPAQ